jgi:hypothetical protein
MKKANPIQLVILIIALLLAYNALQTVTYFFWILYRWFTSGLTLGAEFDTVGLYVLYPCFYTIGTIILIKTSKALSEKIAAAAFFSSDTAIFLKRNDIIYATLVVMGAYILTTRVPKLLVDLYSYIRQGNDPLYSGIPNVTMPGEGLPELIMITIFASVMLVYAKILTEFITRHIKEEPDIDAIGTAAENN